MERHRKNTYSVLMSVYEKDNPKFLELALKSIFDEQTMKPDEIIVVFDGMLNDGLYQVLQRFQEGKESIVRYIQLQENGGLGNALRIGTEACVSDYIFRMDADDISHPKRFEIQMTYVETHPDVDVIGTDIAEFQHTPAGEMRIRSCPATHLGIMKMAKRRNPMNHVSVCMKRKALVGTGGYKTLNLLEDYYLWLRMMATGYKFANINEPLVYVRVGNGFTTKRGAKERIQGWWVLQCFMLNHAMISKWEAGMNMIYVNMFVRSPEWIKKILYDTALRK